MRELLEELYKSELTISKYIDRKISIDEKNYQITGITQSGKTYLIKSYLLSLKRSKYLYINIDDIRMNIDELNSELNQFCIDNKIESVAIENYVNEVKLPNVSQIIISSEIFYNIDNLIHIKLDLLDFEEFLAYEHKFDSSALNHFFQLGSFCSMHTISQSERALFIQKFLYLALDEIEFDIMIAIADTNRDKISPFSLYDDLKQKRKISKDRLYESFNSLLEKGYIHKLSKFNHQRAINKIYLCDISVKSALSTKKHFANLFESTIYSELNKHNQEVYYYDGIDFYLPSKNRVILSMPFANEHTLFKKLGSIEAFIFGYQIKYIDAVSMNSEGSISHPMAEVNMIPFSMWALGD